jgi:hypothetical protein
MSNYTPFKLFYLEFQNSKLDIAASDHSPTALLLPPPKDSSETFPTDTLSLLRLMVQQTLLLNCIKTKNTTEIKYLTDVMTFSYFHSKTSKTFRIRDTDGLKRALEVAIQNKDYEPKIQVNTNALYFDPTFNGINLDLVKTTPIPLIKSNPIPSSGHSPTPLSTHPTTSHSMNHPTITINFKALPQAVRERYEAHIDPDITLTTSQLTPFTTGPGITSNYYHDPSITGPVVILRIGAFLAATRDFKRFLKNYPTCADNSPSALRQWYTHFTAHAHSCGYFIMPYELLHRIHGGMLGFEFGIDLPLDRQSDSYHWQTDIRNLLLESKMFPTNSEYASRVQSSTNGYHALMNLIHDSHPDYVSSPISLAPNWPHQKKDETLHNFYNRFTETHKLRAIFLQDIQDLGTDMMIDIFIHRCTH